MIELIIPAFIAGLLTFLAPCTLPLVPGYLSFIGGASSSDLKNPLMANRVRWKIFLNGVFYVIGFSIIFILLGSVFSLGGLAFAKYKAVLAKMGGVIIIFFGLYLTGIFSLPIFSKIGTFDFLRRERHLRFGSAIKPGEPLSSFILGTTFALGWTPCVGPILGSILLIASTTGTIFQGMLLLAVFSLGLTVPFLAVALAIGSASKYLAKWTPYLNIIAVVGGIFLIFIGFLLLTDRFARWISYAYQLLQFINYDKIINNL